MHAKDQRARFRALLMTAVGLGVIALTGVLPAAEAETNELPLGRLVWENGDVLPGTMIGATATELTWKSPVFASPFLLDLEHLKSVHFPAASGPVAHDEPLSFQTKYGDVVHGRLVGVTGDSLVVDSSRHGRLVMRRDAVRSFGRVDPRVLDRPDQPDASGWRSLSTTQTVSQWRANTDGHLSTRIIGAELGGDFKLPEVAEIDLALSWREEPAFVITLASVKAARFGGQVITLEAGDGRLLLKGPTRGATQHLANLLERSRQLHLRILWDQRNERLSIYSSAGNLLGRTSAGRSIGTGLYVKNTGSDLTVERLRMRPSDGAVGREASGEAHFRTFNGQGFHGRLIGFDRSNGAIVAEDSAGARRTIAADDLVGVYFTTPHAPGDETARVKVRFYDGTVLRGNLHSLDGGTLELEMPLCEEPVASRLAGIREMVFLSARRPAPDEATDVLEIGGGVLTGVLHGAVAPVETNGSTIGWRPVGSRNASALTGDYPVRIVRHSIAGREGPARLPRTDVLYLDNGDVIPCRFQELDEEHAVVECDLGQNADIPLTRVRAIEFNSETAAPVIGFEGDGWEKKAAEENAVRLIDGRAVFTGRATLSHDHILQGDDLLFDVRWNPQTQCVVTISLHAREGRVAAQNTLLLYFLQGRLLVRGPQGRAFVGQEVVGRANRLERLRERETAHCEAQVRISTSGKDVKVFIDDSELITFPLPDRDHLGKGIIFSVQPVAVRRVRVVDANGKVRHVVQENEDSELLTISNLTVSRLGNAMRFLNVGDQHLESVLTVPRSRKQNPPSHLLVAQNGDLLRGDLVGMDDDVIRFKSRLETLAIDRDRVDAIVWLKEPQSEPSAGESPAEKPQTAEVDTTPEPLQEKGSVQAVLSSGTRVSFSLQQMTGEFLEGEHSILGTCRVATDEVLEFQVGGQVRPSSSAVAYSEWQLTFAKEPFPDSAEGASPGEMPGFGVDSPLVGTAAADFTADLLDGGRFRLGEHAGKIIVLDFWTTWCGPCARALPEIMEAVGQFPPDQVLLVAVNLQETEKAIHDYLDAREWDLTVAVDRDGRIGRQFHVEAIPQTVIIGMDGKIERLQVGAHPNLQAELTRALEALLNPPEEQDAS